MAIVLVERELNPPVRFEDVQAIEDRAAWCFDLHGVRFLHSYFASDATRMICVYEAPDAESVREANRKAKLPFVRVWAAELMKGAG